jgi:hypothetical protein
MTTFLSWELAPAAGSAAGRFAIAGLRRNIHIKRPTRSPLQVSSDNPPGRCLVHCSIQQISLTSINYTVHNRPAGTPLLVLTSSRTQKLEYNERWLRHRCDVRASLYPVSVTRISKLHSYLRASVGLSCEARLAGSIPNTTPTATETPKATTTDVSEMGM